MKLAFPSHPPAKEMQIHNSGIFQTNHEIRIFLQPTFVLKMNEPHHFTSLQKEDVQL